MLDLAGDAPAKQVAGPVGSRSSAGAKSLLSVKQGSPRLSTRSAATHTDQNAGRGDHVQQTSTAIKSTERFAGLKRGLGSHVANLFGLSNDGPNANSAVHAADEAPQYNVNHTVSAEYPAHEFGNDGEKPLIDLSIMIAAVWRFRGLIVASSILGAIAGVLIALSTPHKFYAEARLFMDPREIRLTEDELRSPLMSTEAMIAMIDSQAAILESSNVLIQVVDNLGLADDAEFNGTLNSGGISGGISLIKDLITGKDASSDGNTEALIKLRDSMRVSRDPKTFVINIGVSSRDPEKSALITNAIVQTYLDSEGEAQSGLMERTSEAIDSRLESLRSDLNVAERAVENFKAENDLISVGKELIDDQQITAINQQLANARSTKVAVGVKADGLKKANIADVIEGVFPEEFLSANLIELRKQYSQSKSNADSLGSRLGPRHPQFIAANSTLDSIKSQIRSELRRIVASSQSELQRAIETEQEMAAQLAVAKTRSLENSEELVTLRELDRKATATRQIYEAFLKRSREASERGNFNTQNARVISPAEPPQHPSSTSRKIIAIGGMVVGGILGLGIVLLIGMVESIRSFLPGRGPDGGRPRTPGGSPRSGAPTARQFGYQFEPPPGSNTKERYAATTVPAQPTAAAAATAKTEKTENAELAGNKNSIRDDDMYNYDPVNHYTQPYGQAPSQPIQPLVPPHSAYQGQPYYPVAPAPYHGQVPYAGQGGYAPVQQQPAWPQVPPVAYVAPQPVYPGHYPPDSPSWGYAQPQPQPQPQPYHPAGWAPIQTQPPMHYPQPPVQQPVQQQYYQPQPTQVPGMQQMSDNYAHAGPGNQRQQGNSNSEILEIRQKMDDLRQRIDQKNRRRAG